MASTLNASLQRYVVGDSRGGSGIPSWVQRQSILSGGGGKGGGDVTLKVNAFPLGHHIDFPQKRLDKLDKTLLVIRSVGAIGVVLYFLFWLPLVYEKPSVHPSISEEECQMIESKQGESAIVYEVNRFKRDLLSKNTC